METDIDTNLEPYMEAYAEMLSEDGKRDMSFQEFLAQFEQDDFSYGDEEANYERL